VNQEKQQKQQILLVLESSSKIAHKKKIKNDLVLQKKKLNYTLETDD